MPVRTAFRSRLVLAVLEGQSVAAVASSLGTRPATVRVWLRRVAADGIDVVWRDAPGRGRKPSIDRGVVAAVLALRADRGTGPDTSLRAVARRFGISASTVRRIWQRADGDGR